MAEKPSKGGSLLVEIAASQGERPLTATPWPKATQRKRRTGAARKRAAPVLLSSAKYD